MRPLLILIVLVLGLGLWFWLLLGDRTPSTHDAPPVRYTETLEREATSTEEEDASVAPEDAPPQTDVGMEFPVIEE